MAASLALPLLVALSAAFADDPPKKADPPKPKAVAVWEGPLTAGAIELRMIFNILEATDGKLSATLDVPDQGAKGVPCGEVKQADGKLVIQAPLLKGKYEGKLSADGKTAVGEWTQSGQTFKLTLTRVEKATEVRRPQTPKPPFPYTVEEVTFDNPAAKITLAGTLTLPKGDGPFPAAVLVSGSGPQDRDETIFQHKPFWVLADHLTRNGIAVLRYDDRGVGKSKGKFADAITADFAADAHAAVRFLRSRQGIDPKRVGIIGHSEGGLIAPMVAADHPAEVGFIVMLSGTGLPGTDILAAQIADLMKASGEKEESIKLAVDFQKVLMAAVVQHADPAESKKAVVAEAEKFVGKLTEAQKKALELGKDGKPPGLDQLNAPWMRYFLTADPRPTLARVKCPVLALNGDKDLQVRAKDNLPAVEKAVKGGGNAAVTTRELPDLNHLFQTSKTGLVTEYGRIEETFAPAALQIISDWIKTAGAR
ncbi:MAG: alpha/beta hydrolase [Gemmataceae bacterium]